MTDPSALAVAVVTIERPQAAQRLIRSVRRYYPHIPIYVADQSRRTEAMRSFYDAMRVRVVRMPFDSGVCASRNQLVASITEPYFLLCDDDFVFGPETVWTDALAILSDHHEIGVVGGRLIDLGETYTEVRRWELLLSYDPDNRLLTSVPIDDHSPAVQESGRVPYYRCDAVLNFAVMRRSIFAFPVRWDERFKSNGEHEDFFLNLKVSAGHGVAYLPSMLAYHHQPAEYRRYRSGLRERAGGWLEFMDKWGIDQYVEVGSGLRSRAAPDLLASCESTHRLNSAVRLEGDAPRAESEGLTSHEEIRALSGLELEGSVAAADGELSQLFARTRGVRSAAGDPDLVRADPSGQPSDYASAAEFPGVRARSAGRVYFRYDPVLHEETDFLIWYRARLVESDADTLPVTLRWFDDHGRPLPWNSPPRVLGGLKEPYWQPLVVETPPFERDCGPVRFEILEASGPDWTRSAIGFVVRPPDVSRRGGAHSAAMTWDVMTLCLRNASATLTASRGSLGRLQRSADLRIDRASLRAVAETEGLKVMELGPNASLRRLVLVEWPCCGEAVLEVDLDQQVPDRSRLIALPTSRAAVSTAKLYGYDAQSGVCRIEAW